MSDFIAILPLQVPLEVDAVRRLARHGCLDIHQVDWLRCYLAADGTRMLCWYQAHDAESVRLVLRQQGSGDAAVRATQASEPAPVEEPGGAAERVLVELGPDSDAVAALRAGGYVLHQAFTSQPGRGLICLVEGCDDAGVMRCLTSAGIEPVSVWRCVELDPRPSKLFASQAREAPPVPAPGAGIERSVGLSARAAAMAGETGQFDAVIIGAGLSGICALERLLRLGLRARLYEAGSDVGGVWHWNRYPGARVDSETYTYGFSFSDELVREWEWQELFSPQHEIADYLRHVADRFGLRRHMRFDTRVTAAAYDEPAGLWRVETGNGEQVKARDLIAATGTLSTPQLPDYPGMNDFSGLSHHTARWPEHGVELAGKRVGVVGTGASGVQVIQTIAGVVQHLTVFQRTPTYCVPQRNQPLGATEHDAIRRSWAEILAACRESYGGFIHTFDPRSGLAVSAAEREAKFEALWQTPGFAFWVGNFADLMMNMDVNVHASDFVRRKIRARVHDPEVARKLLPEHPFGTKRVPLENGYYEVYNRPNVRLVDLREMPIERITPDGIRTSAEEHRLDVIVYATGFDAGTGSLSRIDLRGEGGLAIADKWRDGPKTFLGLLINGFPNLFVVNGPHNAAALCNAGRCIEQNVDWIARCIEHMRAHGFTRIVPTAAAEAEWTEHVEDVAAGSVLGKMTNSWFFGANTPGKPRRVTIYAAGARAYRQTCEDVASRGYPGLIMN